MDINFFKETRVLDGGMGQELLARGMETNGTLWSANALLQEKYHQLLLDTHLDFINSGAEIIVTTTFTTRRMRLRDNGVEDKFEYLNTKAGEIAKKAKDFATADGVRDELLAKGITLRDGPEGTTWAQQ